MTQALILVNGFAASDDALPINNLVTLSNDNGGGELTYTWSITAQPPGPADALTSTNTLSTTLTPTKEGNYRIQLIVNQGLGTERVATAIVGVLQVRSAISQPAAGETTELGAQGWAVRMNQTIRLVDQLNTDPGSFICVTAAGEAVGTPVVISGAQVIMAGLPGETTVPTVVVADAAAAADIAGPVGVILGTVDGGPPGPGSLVYVRMNGLASVPVSGSPAAGTQLVAAGTPAATIVDITTLGPTDPYRYVGVSCGADPLVGANTLIAWAGAGAGAPVAAASANVAWNGQDDTQFTDAQTLPAPNSTLTNGASVINPELNVVTNIGQSPSGKSLNLTADEIVNGSAIWIMNPLVPLESIKRYKMRAGFPSPGPAASSGENVLFGICYAGDTAGFVIADLLTFIDDGAGNINTHRQTIQVNLVDSVIAVLKDDTLPSNGYFWEMSGELYMTRNDSAYAGAPGVPIGTNALQATAWVPGPGSGPNFPTGSLLSVLAGFYAPGPAWATSDCNRVGVILGGAWTNALSGAQTVTITSLEFEVD